MNRGYWNRLADRYEDEIFSVLANDRAALVADRVRRYGRPDRTATDVGCGIGHFLPLLAANFARVLAADFALCVNVAIAPDLAVRHRLLDVVARHLRPGGHLVLVVPALESILLTDFRLIQWNLRDGQAPGRAAGAGYRAFRSVRRPRLHEGVVPIAGVATKHYLRDEIAALLAARGLRPLEFEKIEYPWTSEFTDPPRWMQAPYPWDWLCVARKAPARAKR